MSDSLDRTLDLLSTLHSAERNSVLAHLVDLSPTTGPGETGTMLSVGAMVEQEAEHARWLEQAAEQAGGGLTPGRLDASRGHLHYLDLATLLPLAIENLERIVELYSRILRQGGLTPQADQVVTRIFHRHQDHLRALRAMLPAGSPVNPEAPTTPTTIPASAAGA